MVRIVKREFQSTGSDAVGGGAGDEECVLNSRLIRSGYHAVKTRIHDQREEILRADSTKFKELFQRVEDLHKQVRNPREQVADAEALRDITSSLLFSVKAVNKGGITPAEFTNSLLRDFRQKGKPYGGGKSVAWKDIGVLVSHIFKKGHGCCTMIGPMNAELKKRRVYVRRKRVRPTETSKPGQEPFAQTVENLFALSFLVKDGRAEISVDDKGFHLVSPRNAPSNRKVLSGEAAYYHFVFRFDYKDWKLMACSISVGEELMPPRQQDHTSYHTSYTQGYPVFAESNDAHSAREEV